ncbi:MAG TPA: BTAD domain-containing putative transcriptional regulator [Streptosporangiaceae bacterium]|nr:BTAD domain-containing putative transcriptional regulator [Streptosporangiaceae bacterium]
MKSLAIRVLSDFGVDGIEPQTLGSRKARTALHLLALAQGHSLRSDVLVEALWGDSPPARPDDQLAVLMSRLRSVLGRDRIEHRDGGYLLRYDWLDAVELSDLLEEVLRRLNAGNLIGAASGARVALSLASSASPDRPPGHWAEFRCNDLDRLIGRARRVAAQTLVQAGDWMAAADAAAGALERDPYDEASLRTLLTAQAMGGQVGAALAAYERVRSRLAEDLGVDPAPPTSELYTAILRGEPVPGAGPAAGAARASAAAGLVGRDDELALLDAAVLAVRGGSAGSASIIVVEGEPGIGKTSLITAWASRRADAGDTVLLASCGQLDRAMPLDAVLNGLAAVLRRLDPGLVADLLGPDTSLLAPLVRLTSAPPLVSDISLADSVLGPRVLYAALCRVLGRLTERGPVTLIVDDAHLVGQPLADLLDFIVREGLRLPVVAAVRPGYSHGLPATAWVQLDVLGQAAAAKLVGPARVGELYERSKGHPLFLTELAQQSAGAELPASLVESVSARCDELGPAGVLLRTAAVIGPELDIDLLAAVLGRPVVQLLDDAERAVSTRFLVEEGGVFRFRHELVRDALAASASAGRAALLHRQAGRVLARRASVDPVIVAQHARLGGDLELAAHALADGAARAAERFDHGAAEALLDDSLVLAPSTAAWLARARVRTRRRHYDEALADVDRALDAGSAALEVGAWASYFARRFAQAAQFADDGALAASDQAIRARCLAVGGRTRHAGGDLVSAETLLGEAFSLAEGADRVTAAAWLGVLRSHQSRTAEALKLLRPAARGQVGVEHTSATLHALLFTGHAHALVGQPAAALDAFDRYTAEVERRQVPRFGGRAVNFAGWVLRNVGAVPEGLDLHLEALEIAQRQGTAEVAVAALEDLAECCLDAGDLDGCGARLDEARALLVGDLVFGWRLELKYGLISGRLALARGEIERAGVEAGDLEARASALGVPRYVSAARLLRHRADHGLGMAVDPAVVEADLDGLEGSVAIESWWWTGDVALEFGREDWLTRAVDQAGRLAEQAGPHADVLLAAANRRLRARSP